MPTHGRAKMAAAAAVAAGALTLATGLAVAVDLPDQASDTAEERQAEVHATTTTSTTTTLATTTTVGTDDVETEGAGERPTDTHGYEVSTFATTTDLDGRDKGDAISDLASDNAQSGAATTGTVTADEHRSTERGKSADHRPADD